MIRPLPEDGDEDIHPPSSLYVDRPTLPVARMLANPAASKDTTTTRRAESEKEEKEKAKHKNRLVWAEAQPPPAPAPALASEKGGQKPGFGVCAAEKLTTSVLRHREKRQLHMSSLECSESSSEVEEPEDEDEQPGAHHFYPRNNGRSQAEAMIEDSFTLSPTPTEPQGETEPAMDSPMAIIEATAVDDVPLVVAKEAPTGFGGMSRRVVLVCTVLVLIAVAAAVAVTVSVVSTQSGSKEIDNSEETGNVEEASPNSSAGGLVDSDDEPNSATPTDTISPTPTTSLPGVPPAPPAPPTPPTLLSEQVLLFGVNYDIGATVVAHQGQDTLGTMPTEIGFLTNLVRLYLSFNELSGSIPTEIGYLTSLTELVINYNDDPFDFGIPSMEATGLKGLIPSEIGYLNNLVELDLEANALAGTIPTEVGFLTKLTSFSTGLNLLTGTIPSELFGLSQLQRFSLSSNKLTGAALPLKLLTELSALVVLNLQSNDFTGIIPTEVGLLTHLTYLNLHNNEVVGSIPSEIGLLTGLDRMALSANYLAAIIPSELGLLTRLTYLDLHTNDLVGSIPSEIGLLTRLESLRLWENYLQGSIPSEMGNLSRLDSLYLHENSLVGTVPSLLCNITIPIIDCDEIACGSCCWKGLGPFGVEPCLDP